MKTNNGSTIGDVSMPQSDIIDSLYFSYFTEITSKHFNGLHMKSPESHERQQNKRDNENSSFNDVNTFLFIEIHQHVETNIEQVETNATHSHNVIRILVLNKTVTKLF